MYLKYIYFSLEWGIALGILDELSFMCFLAIAQVTCLCCDILIVASVTIHIIYDRNLFLVSANSLYQTCVCMDG